MNVYLLASGADSVVVVPGVWKNVLAKCLPCLENRLGQVFHSLIYDIEVLFVGKSVLKQFVALEKQSVILLKGGHVFLIQLREDKIDKSAAFFAGFAYQSRVGRGYHHYGQLPDVGGQPVVWLVVPFETFLSGAAYAYAES